jgi:hypothetical protein
MARRVRALPQEPKLACRLVDRDETALAVRVYCEYRFVELPGRDQRFSGRYVSLIVAELAIDEVVAVVAWVDHPGWSDVPHALSVRYRALSDEVAIHMGRP